MDKKIKKGSALSIFTVAYKKYSKLPQEERQIITSSLIWLILLIVLAAIIDTIRSSEDIKNIPIVGIAIAPYIKILSTILAVIIGIIISIMAAIIFSIFDRLNILTPIERDMHIQIEQLSSNIQNLTTSMNETLSKNSGEVDEIIEKFTNYDKYLIARSRFGFQAMIGAEGKKDISSPDVEFEKEFEQRHFSMRLFYQAKAGSEISYLNSFITHYQLYGDAIRQALRNSANVKLLLMRPDIGCAAMMARYNDCYRHAHQSYTSFDEFVEEVRHSFHYFEKLKEEADANQSRNGKFGELQVRSYSVSLNSPMIFVKDNKNSQYPDVAYTGFYTNTIASGMPYIEWRGGDRRIIYSFYDVFDAKWQEEDHSKS